MFVQGLVGKKKDMGACLAKFLFYCVLLKLNVCVDIYI